MRYIAPASVHYNCSKACKNLAAMFPDLACAHVLFFLDIYRFEIDNVASTEYIHDLQKSIFMIYVLVKALPRVLYVK